MDDDLFVIPSDNILIGEADGVFVGGDQDLLSESESIVGPPGPPGPPGRDGVDGVDGQSATVTVGSTTTTAPGTDAVVTNVGTNLNAILDFSIPRGAVGETGPAGADGVDGVDGSDGFSPIATVTQTEYGASISITDANGTTTAQVVNGSQGEPGTPGAAATVSVGSTTTGAAGTSASVVNSGTSSAAVLDFVIPRGADGLPGQDGQDGVTPVITATASVDSSTGTPSVSVYKTGTDEYPQFDFAFEHLKGADGITPDTTITDYTIADTPAHWAGTNAYLFRKQLGFISLSIDTIWMNSIAANTWRSIGTISNTIAPTTSITTAIAFTNGNGQLFSFGKMNIQTDGNVRIMAYNALGELCAISGSISWIK